MKLLLVLIAFTLTTESYAQVFGVKAGMNLSKIMAMDDEDNYSDEYKMNPGFHVGPTVEFYLSELISFETGLLLSTKGFRMSEEETYFGDTYEYKIKANLLYIDVPILAKGNFVVGDVKIYGVLGPHIGMGLSGKFKEEYTANGETETDEEVIEWGSDPDKHDIKRPDFGITAGAGIEINSVQVGISYGLGLANISAYTEGGNKISNRVLGLSIGYKFGGN